MEELKKEILDRIKELRIDCPDCEYVYSDDQYTCAICWCEGGQGKLNAFDYLKDHKELLDDK